MERIVITGFNRVPREGRIYEECEIRFANYTGKTIKYLQVEVGKQNRVGDEIGSSEYFQITGPFYPNNPNDPKSPIQYGTFLTDFILRDEEIESLYIVSKNTVVIYDDTEENIEDTIINRNFKGAKDYKKGSKLVGLIFYSLLALVLVSPLIFAYACS